MNKIYLTEKQKRAYVSPISELAHADEEENFLTTFEIPDVTEEEEDW